MEVVYHICFSSRKAGVVFQETAQQTGSREKGQPGLHTCLASMESTSKGLEEFTANSFRRHSTVPLIPAHHLQNGEKYYRKEQVSKLWEQE